MPSNRTTKAILTCRHCGKTFEDYPSQFKDPTRACCSRACGNASRRRTVACVCITCDRDFTTIPANITKGGGKFCSPACYHKDRETRPRKIGATWTSGGYRFVYWPGHPRAGSDGSVREHIIVAEETLGRPLADGEIVHHRNDDGTDNRPENLEVLSGQSEHFSLHMRQYHRDHPEFRHLSPAAKRAARDLLAPRREPSS